MSRDLMRAALAVEWLKLKRSRVMVTTTTVVLVAPPLLAAAFAAAAGQSGTDPMTLKARAMLPGPGWEGFVSALGQVFATGGLLGMGIGVAWCFGREYADRTMVSLYASATPRGIVAAAKLLLLALWTFAIAAALGPTAILIGLAAGLGPPGGEILIAVGRVVVMAGLTGLLALSVSVFASLGRGYLAAFGGLIGLIVAAQVAVLAGFGAWFPLSSPALWAADAPAMASVSIAQLALVPITSLALAVGTVAWWQQRPLV
ncbi:MAG: ABC transporter permease [Ornithinimicrobium sp.]